MTFEHPISTPPPLAQSKVVNGKRVPIMETPTIECGQKVELRGIGWVVCIRRKGHLTDLTLGHSNGYTQWAFDAPADKENPA